MSELKDFGDPFSGDDEGFPDDIDLGDLDALEIVDCWEEDDAEDCVDLSFSEANQKNCVLPAQDSPKKESVASPVAAAVLPVIRVAPVPTPVSAPAPKPVEASELAPLSVSASQKPSRPAPAPKPEYVPVSASDAEPAPSPAPKADPAPSPALKAEPVPLSTPKAEPAPSSTPKAEPAPSSTPKAEPAPSSTPKAEPAPSLTPKAEPAPSSTPKAEPAPAHKVEHVPASAPKAEPVPVSAPKAEPLVVLAQKAEPVLATAPKAEPVPVSALNAEPAPVAALKAESLPVPAPKTAPPPVPQVTTSVSPQEEEEKTVEQSPPINQLQVNASSSDNDVKSLKPPVTKETAHSENKLESSKELSAKKRVSEKDSKLSEKRTNQTSDKGKVTSIAPPKGAGNKCNSAASRGQGDLERRGALPRSSKDVEQSSKNSDKENTSSKRDSRDMKDDSARRRDSAPSKQVGSSKDGSSTRSEFRNEKNVEKPASIPRLGSTPRNATKSTTSTKKSGGGGDSTLKDTSDINNKIDMFLQEIASNHPVVHSLHPDPDSSGLKKTIMDLPDGPPGVDLDELDGDTSTARLNTQKSPGAADGPTRIDGRLYADYAQIFGDDEKRFSISPERERHSITRPLEVDTHPAMKILWDSPPRRTWAGAYRRTEDDEALRALSRSLSRETIPSASPCPRTWKSKSRSPQRHPRISPPRSPQSPRSSPVRAPLRSRISPRRTSPRPRRVSPRSRLSPRARSPRSRVSPRPRPKKRSLSPRVRSPDPRSRRRILARGKSRSPSLSPRRSSSKPRTVGRSKRSRSKSTTRARSRPRSRSRSRLRHRPSPPRRSRSRHRETSSPASRPRQRLSRWSRSRSPPRRSRTPLWTEDIRDKSRKRPLSPDRTSPIRSKIAATGSSPPSWLPHTNSASPFSMVPPVLSDTDQLEQDMARFIASNMAKTGQPVTVYQPSAPPATILPYQLDPVPVSVPASMPVSMSVSVPQPVPSPPPPPPPPALNSYFHHLPQGMSVMPENLATPVSSIHLQEAEPPKLSLSSFLEAAVKGTPSSGPSVHDQAPAVVPRIDLALLTRCKEAVIALSGLSSYGRFVFSASSVPPTLHSPEQFQPWESPLVRSAKVQPTVQFSSPTPEQKAEHDRVVAVAKEAKRVQAARAQEPPPPRFRELEMAVRKEEPAPVQETHPESKPSETDLLKQRLESALEDNKKLMLRLTSWLNADKVDASVQTPGLLVCNTCQEAKPTAMFKLQPEPEPVKPLTTSLSTAPAASSATSTVAKAVATRSCHFAADMKPIPTLAGPKAAPKSNPPRMVPAPLPPIAAVYQPPRSKLEKFQFIGDRHVNLISEYYQQTTAVSLNVFCSPNVPLTRLQSDLARLKCVAHNTVLLAGARDFLDSIDSNVYNYFTGIFNYVRKHSNLLLAVTLPPIPKLLADERYKQQIAKINHYIRSARSAKVVVCDAYVRFFESRQLNQVNLDLFDAEGIYPNAQGVAVLFQAMDEAIASYKIT